MSAHVQASITALEQELEATQQRCHLIERAITGLREIYGSPIATRAARQKPSRRSKVGNGALKKRTNERTNEQKAGRRVVRSLPKPAVSTLNRDQHRTDQIFAFLKKGAQSTAAIAADLNADKRVTKMALQRLKKTGALVSVGWARGAKWALAGTKPAKEDP